MSGVSRVAGRSGRHSRSPYTESASLARQTPPTRRALAAPCHRPPCALCSRRRRATAQSRDGDDVGHEDRRVRPERSHDLAGAEVDRVAGWLVGVGVQVVADRLGGLDPFAGEYTEPFVLRRAGRRSGRRPGCPSTRRCRRASRSRASTSAAIAWVVQVRVSIVPSPSSPQSAILPAPAQAASNSPPFRLTG